MNKKNQRKATIDKKPDEMTTFLVSHTPLPYFGVRRTNHIFRDFDGVGGIMSLPFSLRSFLRHVLDTLLGRVRCNALRVLVVLNI